jgi:hypothetical protein
MENKISITVDWDLEYDEGSLNDRIETAIINAATQKYLNDLDASFAEKLEQMLHDQAFKIVKDIKRFQLDKCNSSGIKETISMEDFIIKKSIESLEIKRDKQGRASGNYSNDDKRTMVEWVIADTVTSSNSEFMKVLKRKIEKIEKEYQDKLQEMVTKTLAPVYSSLVEKLNK